MNTPVLVDRNRFASRYGICYEVLGTTVREVPGSKNPDNETLWFQRVSEFDEAVDIAVENLVSERFRGFLEARRRLGIFRFVPDRLISALLYPFGIHMRAIAEQISWRKEEILGHEDCLVDIERRRADRDLLSALVDFKPLPDFIPLPFSPRLDQPFWTVTFRSNATGASMHITRDRIARIFVVENFAPGHCLFDVRCESENGASFCGFDIDHGNACFRAAVPGVYHHLTREGAEEHAKRIARLTTLAVARFLLPEPDSARL